jgi:acetylxylan esterase
MFHSFLLSATILTTALGAPLSTFSESYADPFPDVLETIVQKQAASCPPSHLIIARGSLEAQGPGSLISMANKIIAANPGTTMEAVIYPATIDNYGTSSGNGTVAVGQMLSSFVQMCPNAKLAMLGYSQVILPLFRTIWRHEC